MSETEVDSYTLDCKTKKFSLKVCLYNGSQILFVLSNKQSPEKYRTLFTLEQLQDLSPSFNSSQNISQALLIIKNTIESGKIALEEKSRTKIELELNINQNPPFIINLLLIGNESEILSYQNQQINEFSQNAQTAEYKTTEPNPIVLSNVKPNAMEFEYIQPILQLHYPDGSTKNTPLTPTLQGAQGKNQNVTEDQLKNIQNIINRDINKGIKTENLVNIEDTNIYTDPTPIEDTNLYSDSSPIEDTNLYNNSTPKEDNNLFNNSTPIEDTNLYNDSTPIEENNLNDISNYESNTAYSDKNMIKYEKVNKNNDYEKINEENLFEAPKPTLQVNKGNLPINTTFGNNIGNYNFNPSLQINNGNIPISTINPTNNINIPPTALQTNTPNIPINTVQPIPNVPLAFGQQQIYSTASVPVYSTASVPNYTNYSTASIPVYNNSSVQNYNTALIPVYGSASIPNFNNIYSSASIPVNQRPIAYNQMTMPSSQPLYNSASLPAYQNPFGVNQIPSQSLYQSNNILLPPNQSMIQPTQSLFMGSQNLVQSQVLNQGIQYQPQAQIPMSANFTGFGSNVLNSSNYLKRFYFRRL